jgi:hypothetical protein
MKRAICVEHTSTVRSAITFLRLRSMPAKMYQQEASIGYCIGRGRLLWVCALKTRFLPLHAVYTWLRFENRS